MNVWNQRLYKLCAKHGVTWKAHDWTEENGHVREDLERDILTLAARLDGVSHRQIVERVIVQYAIYPNEEFDVLRAMRYTFPIKYLPFAEPPEEFVLFGGNIDACINAEML